MADLDYAASLDDLRAAPRDVGSVRLIVARPGPGERLVLESAVLDEVEGLVGDNWRVRGSSSHPEKAPWPDKQVTVMNARMATLLGGPDPEKQALAGDQFYVDFDIGHESLPAGSLLRVGSAVLQISEAPHTGCGKFRARFGAEALRFVNSPEGKSLRLRGLNASVVQGGEVRVGDTVERL